MRSQATSEITRAQGAGTTSGEIYMNIESSVHALQDKIERLYDSAVAFGKVVAEGLPAHIDRNLE